MQEMELLRARIFKISRESMPPDPPNKIHIHLLKVGEKSPTEPH